MKNDIVFLAVLLVGIAGLFGYLIVLLYRYAFRKENHNERAHHPLDAKFIAEISPSDSRQSGTGLYSTLDSSSADAISEDSPVQYLESHPFDEEYQEPSRNQNRRDGGKLVVENSPRNNLARQRLKEKLRANSCPLDSDAEADKYLENEYTD